MIHPMEKKNVKFEFAKIYGFVRLSKKKIEKIHRNLRNIQQLFNFKCVSTGIEGREEKKQKTIIIIT